MTLQEILAGRLTLSFFFCVISVLSSPLFSFAAPATLVSHSVYEAGDTGGGSPLPIGRDCHCSVGPRNDMN